MLVIKTQLKLFKNPGFILKKSIHLLRHCLLVQILQHFGVELSINKSAIF